MSNNFYERIWMARREESTKFFGHHISYYDTNKNGLPSAAFKKRRGNCINPSIKYTEGVVDNVPLEGFCVHSIYQDMATVSDPRGYFFEIRTENLFCIIKNSVVENGVIKNKCLWLFSNNRPILTLDGSVEHVKAMERFNRSSEDLVHISKLKVGDIYTEVDPSSSGKTEYIFLGRCKCEFELSVRKGMREVKKDTKWAYMIATNTDAKKSWYTYRSSSKKVLLTGSNTEISYLQDLRDNVRYISAPQRIVNPFKNKVRDSDKSRYGRSFLYVSSSLKDIEWKSPGN